MKVVSVAEMRQLESAAVATGRSEYDLMLCAGQQAAEIINCYSSGFNRAVILAGGGNNAGDALVAANYVNLPCVIYTTIPLENYHGAAADAVVDLNEDIPCEVIAEFTPDLLQPGDLVIDALLGIGFHGDTVREPVASFICGINRAQLPCIALDLPSGLNADTGEVAADDCAVNAQWTITFGAPKRGLLVQQGPEKSGKIIVAPIGLNLPEPAPTEVQLSTPDDALNCAWRVPWTAHKNTRGALLVLAGSREYVGAPVLTVQAALRTGCGMVRLATTAHTGLERLPAAAICRELPGRENGTFTYEELWACQDMADKSSAIVAGPGWGAVQSGVLSELLLIDKPLVLDADGLNLLARFPALWTKRPNVIITPHPGEAARLARAFELPESLSRLELAQQLAQTLGTVTVLKGFHTVIAAPDGRTVINSTGGPELATAGSGDVLAGIIGALLARGWSCFEAARYGALLHGLAGERLGYGLIADDLPQALPELLHQFSLKQTVI